MEQSFLSKETAQQWSDQPSLEPTTFKSFNNIVKLEVQSPIHYTTMPSTHGKGYARRKILTTLTESAITNKTHFASFLAECMVSCRSNRDLDTPKFELPCSITLPLWSTFKIDAAVTSLNSSPVGATKYRFSSLSSPVVQTCQEIWLVRVCELLAQLNLY